MTTHSPVALRELSGNQLYVIRRKGEQHCVQRVGSDNVCQSAIRRAPGVFLASTAIVCEGASEVGLIRGLDDYRVEQGEIALNANGAAYYDAQGSSPDICIKQASVLLGLGYRVMAFIDNDKEPTKEIVDAFVVQGGKLVMWRKGLALEDELFSSLPDKAISSLIDRAKELTEEGLVAKHIETSSAGKVNLVDIEVEFLFGGFTQESKVLLGKAARSKKAGWFKSISKMEGVARDIIGPYLDQSETHFKETLDGLFDWAHGAT